MDKKEQIIHALWHIGRLQLPEDDEINEILIGYAVRRRVIGIQNLIDAVEVTPIYCILDFIALCEQYLDFDNAI